MSRLHEYIEVASRFGSHRSVNLLTGSDIRMKRLCKALKMRIQEYVGPGLHKFVWFKTEDGVALLVSGNRIVAEVLGRFLGGYMEPHQAHQTLYSGVGVNRFMSAAGTALERRVRAGRSFASTR